MAITRNFGHGIRSYLFSLHLSEFPSIVFSFTLTKRYCVLQRCTQTRALNSQDMNCMIQFIKGLLDAPAVEQPTEVKNEHDLLNSFSFVRKQQVQQIAQRRHWLIKRLFQQSRSFIFGLHSEKRLRVTGYFSTVSKSSSGILDFRWLFSFLFP